MGGDTLRCLRRSRRIFSLLVILATLAAVLASALAFGGPSRPPPLASINDPFGSVDLSDLPPSQRCEARDGLALAYRRYDPPTPAVGSVTLVHGSSASSRSMHPLARALAAAGHVVLSLDVRGHGESGRKGHIDHIGQLESDLADLVKQLDPPQPSTLIGFSAGGGFVLRVAGGPRQDLFGSYLMLSPFISQDAPNQRPRSGGWADVGVPRVLALVVLNAIGIRVFNGLPVTRFALNDAARQSLTAEYDFNLALNFRPRRDHGADIRGARRPCAIVAGADDEAFFADRLEGIVRGAGQPWPVELLPGLGHVALTLDPVAHEAVVRHVRALQRVA